ncbi:hypothetical protein KJ836_00570 [Patescibacteria group bacterium]|nr:hypothetical protein [Patescibacteria group bacterium]
MDIEKSDENRKPRSRPLTDEERLVVNKRVERESNIIGIATFVAFVIVALLASVAATSHSVALGIASGGTAIVAVYLAAYWSSYGSDSSNPW